MLDYGFIETEKLNFEELSELTHFEYTSILFNPLEYEFEDRFDEEKTNRCFHATYSKITEQLLDQGALDLLLLGVYVPEDWEKAGCLGQAMQNFAKLQLLLDYNIDVNLPEYEKCAMKIALGEESQRNVENAKLLTRHIVKMISANMFVSERNLNEINSSNDLRSFKIECEKEIESMKIENPSLPFLKILTSNNVNQLAAYARNKSTLEAVSSLKYKAKFPIYNCVLHNQLKKGLWRKMLMDKLKG